MKNLAKMLIILTVLTLVVHSGVLANDQKAEVSGPKFGGTLVIATTTSPQNMDSRWTTFGSAFHALKNQPMFVRPNEVGPNEPRFVKAGWIKSYEFPKSKTLILHIKKGVTYQDGVPVNAKNVRWSMLKRQTSEKLWTELKVATPDNPGKSFKILDDHTLQIDFKHSTPAWLIAASGYTGWAKASETPRARERYGEDYGLKKIDGAVAYGNGPFILKDWVHGDHLTFVRNEDYWWAPSFMKHQGPPYLKKVIVKIIPEPTARLQMLKKGELDMIYDMELKFVPELRKNPNIEVQTRVGSPSTGLHFNVTNPPCDDIKVRKALSYAINRQPIVKAASKGLSEPQHTLYVAKVNVRDTTHRVKYEPEKAKSLLKEAGWTDTDGNGIREKDGKKLKIRLWAVNWPAEKLTSQIIQNQWKNIGVKTDITLMTETALLDRSETGKYEALLYGHYNSSFDDLIWELNPESTWGYPHFEFADTPKLRELIESVREKALTPKEYRKYGDDLVNYVTDQAYRCPLMREASAIGFNKDLQNVQIRNNYWSNLPYLQDVYWQHIYEENLK